MIWNHPALASLSARRAWIEIESITKYDYHLQVALRKESVDRNEKTAIIKRNPYVALRKESVDRNMFGCISLRIFVVALRKESVDRNC